jgi:hypothetical protein
MVESAGNAPALACLQSKCIACLPRPHENWRAVLVLPQARRVLETQLRKLAHGANAFFILNSAFFIKLVRLPGIAPGRSPWQRDILLLNHNRILLCPLLIGRYAGRVAATKYREIKRAGNDHAFPARAIYTKNKHLLVIYAIPTRGFTAAVSVFNGHTSCEALNM